MGKYFKQLTYSDRVKLETLLNAGHTKAYIADVLHCSRQTIYNELKRGSYEHLNWDYTTEKRYSCDLAQSDRDYNQSGKGPGLKAGGNIAYIEFLEKLIVDKKYSPAAALYHTSSCNIFDINISLKTLYRYIDTGLFLRLTNRHLPVKNTRKNKKCRVRRLKRASIGESIENRSPEISDRNTFGSWEMDTVKGKRGITAGCLLVLTERLTRYEIIIRLKDQCAASVTAALDGLEKKYGRMFPKVFKSITVDNGSEFADCRGIKRSALLETARTELYYCHPYSSWERGSNENNNKLIRRHIPKSYDIDKVSDAKIRYIESWMNGYPRKLFDGRSSGELYRQELKKLGL